MTTQRHEHGVTKPLAPSPIRRWRKAIAASALSLGMGIALVGGTMAAPPATPSASGTPTTQSPRSQGTPSAMPSSAPSTQNGQGTPSAPAPDQNAPAPPAPGQGPMGGPGGALGGPGGGKVTAVSGSTITVQRGGPDANGATATVTVNSDTVYLMEKSGAISTGALSNVQVGGTIRVEGTNDGNGNITALVVRIEAPKVGGEVTAVNGNTITVQDKGPAGQGATQTITVGSGTQYVTGGPDSSTASSLSAITVGSRVRAEGTLNSDGSLTATQVRVEEAPSGTPPTPGQNGAGLPAGPKGDGTVTGVSGSTITVQAGGPNANGATSTITVTSGTIYLIGGPDQLKKGSLSDIQAGMHVRAEGTTDANGNVTAVIVRADTPPSTTK